MCRLTLGLVVLLLFRKTFRKEKQVLWGFDGPRYKFGSTFIDMEYDWSGEWFPTAIPLFEIEQAPAFFSPGAATAEQAG